MLSQSHGNSKSERGFSMNKILLESHGYTTDNDTVATLRVVKDSIRKEGGVDKFPITRKLLDYFFNHMQSTRSIFHQVEGKMKKKEISKFIKKLLQLLLRNESKNLKQLEIKLKSACCKWKLQAKSSLMVTGILVLH